MHHYSFVITKFLLFIGILIGLFYALEYIKEKYQAFQAYQVKKIYYQKIEKGKKSLEEKKTESVGEG
jgi:hypothetical protein